MSVGKLGLVLEMTHFGPELILEVGIEFELAILGKVYNIT